MADTALPAPPTPPAPAPPSPQAPQALQQPLVQPVQLPVHPNQPEPTQPIQHMPQLNRSHLKPEFSGKPEDAEAHLLRTNDWMDTDAFPEGVKVERFCLTLVAEAKLWYESLRPINVDWLGLQNQTRQQYSKIGNATEKLFHAWRSFHFDENAKTLDSYIMYIRQVATLLGHGKPQILEVFQNTLPARLYWVLFPIEDIRQVVETAKRILTKKDSYTISGSIILNSVCDNESQIC